MTPELREIFFPLLLVPVLIWIAYRYLPLLAAAGRVRLYLLLGLGIGAIGVQAGGVRTQAYPLTIWTMYSEPVVDTRTWSFVAVGPDGDQGPFPWEKAVPIRSIRAFEANFLRRASLLDDTEDEVERLDRTEELDRLLASVIAVHNGRARLPRVEAIRVERCRVDIRDPRRRGAVECEHFRTVEADAP